MLKLNNTFFSTPKDDWKDRINIEIGDSKQPDKTYPQLKLMRWDNEVNCSVRLKDFDNYSIEDGEKIKLIGDKKEVHLYDLPPSDELKEGGFEFEVILKEKPDTNVMEFSLNAKGLEFFYQPELTQEEIDGGASRPENVIGSYAVYYKNCPTNYVGGKLYRAGKAFHIYRPRIEDAEGNWVWGELHIENGLITVTIPQEFLNNAVYPIKHATGLEFGYTTVGENSFLNSGGDLFGSLYDLSVDGDVSKLTIYNDFGTDTRRIKGIIYDDSFNSEGVTQEAIFTAGDHNDWEDVTFSSSVSLSSGNYILVGFADGVYMARDLSVGTGYYEFDYGYGTPPDPWSGNTPYAQKISIYATYTPAGGGESPSASESATPSVSASASVSATPSVSASVSESATPSSSVSLSKSPSPSISESASISPSASESATPSISESATPSVSESATPSSSESASESSTPSVSASSSVSLSKSPSPSVSESSTPSTSDSVSESASISPSPSASESATPSISVSFSPSVSASVSASSSISASPSVSASASVSLSPSVSESASVSPSPSVSPSVSASVSASVSVSFSPSPSPGTPTEVCFQPTGASAKETYIKDDAPNTNYGGDNELPIGESSAAPQISRGLIQFDLSSIPVDATIISATLTLTLKSDGNTFASNNRILRVYRVIRSWLEAEATWNEADTGTNWGTAGCANTTTDVEASDIGTSSLLTSDSANDEKTFALTPSKIQEMITDGIFANEGFKISADTEVSDQYVFRGAETLTASQRPELCISYTTPGSASPSISASVSLSLSPSVSESVSVSFSPSVSASASISLSPSISASASVSTTESASPSISASASASPTPSISVSFSPSVSASSSISLSSSLSPSVTDSASPSASPSLSASPTPSISASVSVSFSPSPSPSISVSSSFSPSPSPPEYQDKYSSSNSTYQNKYSSSGSSYQDKYSSSNSTYRNKYRTWRT